VNEQLEVEEHTAGQITRAMGFYTSWRRVVKEHGRWKRCKLQYSKKVNTGQKVVGENDDLVGLVWATLIDC